MKLLRHLIVLSLIVATSLPVTAFSRKFQQDPPAGGTQQRPRGGQTGTEGPAQQNPPAGQQPPAGQPANPQQQGGQQRPGQPDVGEGRRPQDPLAAAFNGLRVRSIGPALTSGRVVAFAVDPSDRFADGTAARGHGGGGVSVLVARQPVRRSLLEQQAAEA